MLDARSLACLNVMLLTACGHGSAAVEPAAAAPPAPAPAPAPEPPAPTLAQHMHTNFRLATNARDALVDGDLAGAKDWAQGLLAEDQYTSLPADWRPWIERLRQSAEAVTVAGGVEDTAVAIAQVGLACGSCHWRAGRGPTLAPDATVGHPEPGAPDLETRMQRHRIASDELWYGLIQPSEALWRSGSITFTRAEIAAPLNVGEPVPEWLGEHVEGMRVQAEDARMAATHEARAERYGEILATCANCHAQVERPLPSQQ